MQSRPTRCAPALIAAMVALGGCSTPEPEEVPPPTIKVAGSTTINNALVRMLADGYTHADRKVNFEISSKGTATGFRALLDGEVDLAAASRKSTPAEEEQARINGYDLASEESRHIVAVDVVTLTVHPSNPTDSLTYDQVIGIFCTQTIDSWSYLGMEDRPIRVIASSEGSGTRAFFEDFFCGPRGIHPRVETLSTEAARAALKNDPSAITFVNMSETSGKVLGLRPDAEGYPVLPSQQNIIRGAYPLYHDLYLYTPGAPKGEVAKFIDWIDSPAGQDIVDEARFVPLFLRPDTLDDPRPLRETIQFEPGSSEPNQRSLARMRLLTEELRARAGGTGHIVLEGYADGQEPDAIALSKARAQAVQALLSKGLPGVYFEIIPRGSTRPIAPNTTPYGRQRNRRVQIYLADEEEADELTSKDTPPTE